MTWFEKEIHREYHEAAQIFPLMQGDEFEQLKDDIAANGLLEAIWLHPDDSIIDGRNRHRACIETETEPRFRTWGGDGSVVEFVWSMNFHRRHLTSSQKAAVAVGMLPLLEAEAKERQAHGQTSPGRTLREKIPQATGRASEKAAALVGTNPRYVSDAKKLAKEAPALFEQVREGKKTIPQAKRELVKRQSKPPAPFLEGEYHVLYADPPWQFSNSGFDQSAAAHYPTMSTDKICDLPIDKLTSMQRGTVLFLWATNAMLEDALQVIDAWGFEYKTNLVWLKDRSPGMGWFVKNRHELLLLATNSPGLHPQEKPFSIVEAPVTKHSKKPGCVYEMIERMYDGPYIELFARATREGWDSWGNEF